MEKIVDPRRKEKVNRYKPRESDGNNAQQTDDPMPDYMNILGKWNATTYDLSILKWPI